MLKQLTCQIEEEWFNRFEEARKAINISRNQLLRGMIHEKVQEIESALKEKTTDESTSKESNQNL